MQKGDDEVLVSKEIKFWLERKPRKFTYSRSDHEVLMAKIRANKNLIAEISDWLNKASDVMQDVGLDTLGKKPYQDTLQQLLPYRDPKVKKTMGPEIIDLIERDLLDEIRRAHQDRENRLLRHIGMLEPDVIHPSFAKRQYFALLRTIIAEKELCNSILRLDDAFCDGISMGSLLQEITERIITLSPARFSTISEDDRKKIIYGIIADIAHIDKNEE